MGVGIAAGPHCHPGLVRLDVPGGIVFGGCLLPGPTGWHWRPAPRCRAAFGARPWGGLALQASARTPLPCLPPRGSPVPLRLAANGPVHQPCLTPDAGSRFGPALAPLAESPGRPPRRRVWSFPVQRGCGPDRGTAPAPLPPACAGAPPMARYADGFPPSLANPVIGKDLGHPGQACRFRDTAFPFPQAGIAPHPAGRRNRVGSRALCKSGLNTRPSIPAPHGFARCCAPCDAPFRQTLPQPFKLAQEVKVSLSNQTFA